MNDSQDSRATAGLGSAMGFKAFISYSHAADQQLAPALQRGLHRFAKPTFRIRAMRVFRDETNLSNTPQLWSAIEGHLARSEYFLLLASPQSAKSKWVRKEVDFWLSKKSLDTLLIVLTEGDVVWHQDANDFDWTMTTAIPSILADRYVEEPLYTDLRWARKATDLSLGNPRFKSAVADLAATLLQRSKDELVGADVTQQIRVRRLVAGTIAALATLTLASVSAAAVLFWLYTNELTPAHLWGAIQSSFSTYYVEPDTVKVGPGCFQMGAEHAEQEERPVHQVCISYSYRIGKTEVTFEEFGRFAYATGRKVPDDAGWGKGTMPVINVSWEDARAYASWLRARSGRDYRLPTEAEWEFAARAETTGVRFWGDDADAACSYANVSDRTAASLNAHVDGASGVHKCSDGYAHAAPVIGDRKPNRWGLYDVLGNVWEWVEDCYHGTYQNAPGDGSAWEEPQCELRVLRGGAWNYGPSGVHSANRVGNRAGVRINTLGFRVALDDHNDEAIATSVEREQPPNGVAFSR
jgi:formylglycine-generating enzyme required for sulfatase activity